MRRHQRSAFTIIELLVAIAVIGILVALLLPAVQQVRAAARRTQCSNNLRNIDFAMLNVADSMGRFPACGNFGRTGNHHSWVIDVLPWLEQTAISDHWEKDRPIDDPVNAPLSENHIPILTCPDDISVGGGGDLSYVVNGGIGFTAFVGVHDCPIDPDGNRLDLNGNGLTCSPDPTADGDPSDRKLFFRMGLFFNETWKWDVTVRHHRFATVTDGLSQTIVLSENVRTGFDPSAPGPAKSWASNAPYMTSFYIGDPCPHGNCLVGAVDYRRCNAGRYAINSGLAEPEGSSPIPNSFHAGGVHMAFGDGHVRFVSERLDGRVYAALASPQGRMLQGSPLEQTLVSGDSY
jgi:prepilin-type N-terminal cleavage/methylation domain-containing protein/prepilin-type processing-associated H-X9-DG protein